MGYLLLPFGLTFLLLMLWVLSQSIEEHFFEGKETWLSIFGTLHGIVGMLLFIIASNLVLFTWIHQHTPYAWWQVGLSCVLGFAVPIGCLIAYCFYREHREKSGYEDASNP